MKKIMMISGLILALIAGDLLSSAPAASSSSSGAILADVNVYFTTPDNTDGVLSKRTSFLNAARERVLVAVYWITDDSFANQLITLKRRGVDVQVIFDLSPKNAKKAEALMDKLILNNIVPIVSPSLDEGKGSGVMHNKFMVVDDKDVLTGSANFTMPAFRPTAKYWNDENIVTLRSPAIAKKYADDFEEIELRLFDAYIQFASALPSQVPGWMDKLMSELYKKNDRFKTRVRAIFDQADTQQKNYLMARFPDLMPAQSAAQASMPSSERPISATQIAELSKRGINLIDLTHDDEDVPIADILQENKMQQEAEGDYQKSKKRKGNF